MSDSDDDDSESLESEYAPSPGIPVEEIFPCLGGISSKQPLLMSSLS